MAKKTLLILAFLFCGLICIWGGTHDPWDGTVWDVTSPDIDQPHGNAYKELYDLRKGVALRMNKEHETLATSSAGGVHKQGSARAFFQDAAPTTQVNGDAFDSGDLGSLWFDSNASPDNQFNVLTATTPTWTPISTEVIAVLLAANRQFAGTLTVDGATTLTGAVGSAASITLGAGADLIGSSTSDITIGANKFTVAGATGNTLVAGTFTSTGVATVGDGSLLKTSAAPTTDAMIANKKYVDDALGQSSQVTGTSNISNVTGDWADMANMSITLTTVGGNVLLLFSATIEPDNTSRGLIRFDLDGTTQYHTISVVNGGAGTEEDAVGMQYLLTSLSAAEHTFKVQWKDLTGTILQDGASYPRVFTAIELPS